MLDSMSLTHFHFFIFEKTQTLILHKVTYFLPISLKCCSTFFKMMLIYNLMFPCIKIDIIILEQN